MCVCEPYEGKVNCEGRHLTRGHRIRLCGCEGVRVCVVWGVNEGNNFNGHSHKLYKCSIYYN